MTTYTIEQSGDKAGLRGWWTVSRNGQAIEHYPSESAAMERIAELMAVRP